VFEVRNLVAGYGETIVLRDVSIAVPPSSVVALLGANGAGKTTLLRAVSGLLAPRSGSIRLNGTDLTGQPPHRFAQAGVCHIPEGRGIFRSLTVRENILLQSAAGGDGDALERATGAFPRLAERLRQTAGTLSGGEQQMLALARAYITRPTVVLLDEVSMGLAPRAVDEIFLFLRRLATEGVALLVVEQYVVRAMELADYLFVLNRGRVSLTGERGEVDTQSLFEGYMGKVVALRQ